MLIEGATNPAPEVDTTNPAQEVETETTDTAPEVDVDEATDSTDEDQSTDTAEGDTSEGTKAEEEKLAGLREADYRRKTQELAELRKSVESRQSQLDQVVKQGEAIVQALSDEFQSEFKDVDWGKLAAENPAEYVRLQHQLSQRQQKLQSAIYRLNEAKQVQASATQEATQEHLQRERSALIEKIPEWKDSTKYAAESAQISEFLASAGYKPEEIQGITDHRAVLLARNAMLYARLSAKVPKPAASPTAPPPPPPAPTKAKAPPNPERMSTEEWLRWRNADLAKKAKAGR